MAWVIESPEVEALAEEVAALTGESKSEAVRRALLERKERLADRVTKRDRAARLRRFLELEAWPLVPADERGRQLTRDEEDALLGYGPEGA